MNLFTACISPQSTKISRFCVYGLVVVMALFALPSKSYSQDCGWGYYINVNAPAAGSTFIRGNAVNISWAADYIYWYGNVTTVAIEYSDNGGASYNLIADGIPTDQNSYQWQSPASLTPGSNYYIRVREVPDGYYFGCSPNSPGVIGPLTILKGCFPPVFSLNLAPQSACTGSTVTWRVQTDAFNPTYRWIKDGATISTSSSNTLTISPVSAGSAGLYAVEVIDQCGARNTSTQAGLAVRLAPAITQQPPATISVCENSSVTIGIRAIGDARTFQWRKDGVDIPNARDSNYVISNALATSQGIYECVVSGSCSPAATSQQCTLFVPTKPRITTQPADVAACPGSNTELTVVATGNNLAYQWYKNGAPLPNEVRTTLLLSKYNYDMNGGYHCVVSANVPNPNNCQITAVSRTATVVGIRPPTVAQQPTPTADVCVGGTLRLVTEGNGFDLSYQWYQNGKAIPGATLNELVIPNVTAANAGAYTATIIGACGLNVKTDTARVATVAKPVFTTQPKDVNVKLGEPISLSVSAADGREYEWYRDSKRVAGANGPTLDIAKAAMSDAGLYNAVVRNVCGATISAYARVNVKDPSKDLPELTLATSSIDFGDIPVGYSKTVTATDLVKNTGTAPMTVLSMSIAGDGFAIESGGNAPLTLDPQSAVTLSFRGQAQIVGQFAGNFQVVTNAPNPNGVVLLTANAVLRYEHPEGVDFGSVEAKSSKEVCATLTNTSAVDVTIDGASITGANAALFSVTTATPVSIPAGTSKDVCFSFAPADVGAKAALVNITSSTGGNSSLNLAGIGTPTTSVDVVDMINGLSVSPNPSAGAVVIRSKQVIRSVDIVSATGQTVASIEGSNASTDISWNGRSADGELVAVGPYTAVVRGVAGTSTIQLAIVR
ncbi:MAG: choice-of-anchor D domain-containing protein [Candidatus Kapabacteria bacterium]|nr:choice-of-anchor D domain-containing protein [Candidatus Kapabacteria bacterium]